VQTANLRCVHMKQLRMMPDNNNNNNNIIKSEQMTSYNR